MSAQAIMVLGTSSHVGKSLLTAALCRMFSDHGVRVAPFKSQNMALNSAATVEGLEIGRAQALQAEAARVRASVHMNPILLKPSGDMSSQVVVRGKIWGQISALDYHQRRVEELLPIVQDSYETLAAQYDVIILEGAGSPAEINLKQHDIVNMRIAEMADANCLLVGDIDRGGVFASLFGTIALLEIAEQKRIRGFIINKFRGDIKLLEPGIQMIEKKLAKRCLGVVPYMHRLALEEEDSLGLPEMLSAKGETFQPGNSTNRQLRIAVIALPSLSNFTDFDALRHEPSVALSFCKEASHLVNADIVILPGSKQTVDDLLWMKREGLDKAVKRYAIHGLIVGICGGMQMLGQRICDPHGVEHKGDTDALGLLPLVTQMKPQKVTRQVTGHLSALTLFGQPIDVTRVSGYEIHVGETSSSGFARPFANLQNSKFDGCVSTDGRIVATYLHGIFDDNTFRHTFIASACAFYQMDPPAILENWKALREESLNRLAATVSASLDLRTIFDWVGLTYRAGVNGYVKERGQ